MRGRGIPPVSRPRTAHATPVSRGPGAAGGWFRTGRCPGPGTRSTRCRRSRSRADRRRRGTVGVLPRTRGRPGEDAGGDEDRDVGSVLGSRGAVEGLEVTAADGAVLGVPLALDDDAAAVGQAAGHVRAQIAGAADPPDVGAAVPAAQFGDVLLELPVVHRPHRVQRPARLPPRLLGESGPLRLCLASPGPYQARDDGRGHDGGQRHQQRDPHPVPSPPPCGGAPPHPRAVCSPSATIFTA